MFGTRIAIFWNACASRLLSKEAVSDSTPVIQLPGFVFLTKCYTYQMSRSISSIFGELEALAPPRSTSISSFPFELLLGLIALALLVALVAFWIANIFGLVRAVKTNNTSRVVLHAIGIVVGILGLVMGAIYFFKWRHERLAVRANQTSGGGALVVADELGKLTSLRDQGVITTVEFEVQKKKLFDQ